MVGIQGIAGVPEPVGGNRVQGRSKAPAPSTGPEPDGLQISPQAAKAAAAATQVASTDSQSEIRQERVTEARQRLEEGTHRLQEVILDVASRLSKFVE